MIIVFYVYPCEKNNTVESDHQNYWLHWSGGLTMQVVPNVKGTAGSGHNREVVALYRWPLVQELLYYGHSDFYAAWIIFANKKHVTSHKTT